MNYNLYPLGKPVVLITEKAVRDILSYSCRRQFELNYCVNELKNCYSSSSLYHGNGDADFDDPVYQACYVFLYFPVLCYGTFYGLLMCQENLGAVLERASLEDSLNVCALGGGPGTDLFGVRMFLNNIGYEDVPINATVLDRHPNWSLSFKCLSSNLYQPSNLSAEYFHLEADSRRVLPIHLKAIAAADLVTCSKFVSAVRALDNSRVMLLDILRRVKPGAYIFYVDNSKGGNTEFFRSIAKLVNCTEVMCFERSEDNPYQLPNTENSNILKVLSSSDWFNFKSQRNLRVTFMLWKKISQAEKSKPSSSLQSHRRAHLKEVQVDSTNCRQTFRTLDQRPPIHADRQVQSDNTFVEIQLRPNGQTTYKALQGINSPNRVETASSMPRYKGSSVKKMSKPRLSSQHRSNASGHHISTRDRSLEGRVPTAAHRSRSSTSSPDQPFYNSNDYTSSDQSCGCCILL